MKGKIWYTADLHLRHDKILELEPGRGFMDIMAMETAYIQQWNELIGPDDKVYVIGDFAFVNSKNRDELGLLLRSLHGQKILVRGNHDCSTKRKYLELGFSDLVDVVSVGGYTLFHDWERYRLYKHGAVVLCGHSHSAWAYKPAEDDRPAFVNVGVDATKAIAVDGDYIQNVLASAGPKPFNRWFDPRETISQFWNEIYRSGGTKLELALLEYMGYAGIMDLDLDAQIVSNNCWRTIRKEEYGERALAILTLEGGMHSVFNTEDHVTIRDKVESIFNKHGFYLEGMYAWAWGVYRR